MTMATYNLTIVDRTGDVAHEEVEAASLAAARELGEVWMREGEFPEHDRDSARLLVSGPEDVVTAEQIRELADAGEISQGTEARALAGDAHALLFVAHRLAARAADREE
jgi:hypothetical protein